MLKKALLFLTTLSIIAVIFLIVSWKDAPENFTQKQEQEVIDLPDPEPMTRPAAAANAEKLSFGGANIPPGDSPHIVVYDRQGNAKIVFQSKSWRPRTENETEFDLTEPNARLLLPRGQLAMVSADKGRIAFQKTDGNNLKPQHGRFEGQVTIRIDRTDIEWRKNHPDQAEPEQHPDKIITITLDDVEFDLNFNWLKSQGPVRIESHEGILEGKGLTLLWDETNREVREVIIQEGHRAVLHLSDLMQLTGDKPTPEVVQADEEETLSPEQQEVIESIRGSASQPADGSTDEEIDEDAMAIIELAQRIDKDKEVSVKTYRISFYNDVLIEQRADDAVVKKIQARLLEIIRDFSTRELNTDRGGLAARPANRPATAESRPADVTEPDSHAEPPVDTPKQEVVLHWKGQLVIRPHDGENTDLQLQPGETILLAEGDPLVIEDRDKGSVTCRQLQYRDADNRITIRGGEGLPIHMKTEPARELVGADLFYLDPAAGVARIEGPGHLIDGSRSPGSDPTGLAGAEGDELRIEWQKSLELRFDKQQAQQAGPKSEYDFADVSPVSGNIAIRQVLVQGQPRFVSQGGSIAARDEIEVHFVPHKNNDVDDEEQPNPSRPDIAADKIYARGDVRMRKDDDRIACERLEVDMMIDELGNNLPQVGRAYGNVSAELFNGNNRLEITADEQLIAHFDSVPRKISDQEIAYYHEQARQNDIEEDSPQWQAMEQRLKNKRELILAEMNATGRVGVQAYEKRLFGLEQTLDLKAGFLDCRFAEGDSLERALVMGRDGQVAEVDTGDFYIRGPQIRLDLATESAEVPGAGLLRLYTKQDIDGRPLADPVPITVRWDEQMRLSGTEDVGIFTGNVHAASREITLDSRELRIDFTNTAKEPVDAVKASAPPSLPATAMLIALPLNAAARNPMLIDDAMTVVRRTAGRYNPSIDNATWENPGFGNRLRKRPAYIKAVGDAVLVSQNVEDARAKAGKGRISRWLADLDPRGPSDDDKRTVGQVRVNGPTIAINLEPMDEYFTVEGPGNLLIVDHRLPKGRRATRSVKDLSGSPFAPMTFGSVGPSHTLFRWQNSMTFLNNHNTAVFDHQVEMTHRSGYEMVLIDRILASTDLNEKAMESIESRRVDLSCESFYVQFDRRDAEKSADGSTPLSRAAMLKAFTAAGHVRLQADDRHAEGESIVYNNDQGIARLTGSAEHPPQIIEHDPDTGRVIPWSGKSLEWNFKTKKIRVTESSLLATGS